MRISFTANQIGFELDEFAIVCGLKGTDSHHQDHSLIFQRDAEDSDEDWGVYLEFNDQEFGDYDCVERCLLSRDLLKLELAKQLGELTGVTGFDLSLMLDDSSFLKLTDTLTSIFRGRLDDLILASNKS